MKARVKYFLDNDNERVFHVVWNPIGIYVDKSACGLFEQIATFFSEEPENCVICTECHANLLNLAEDHEELAERIREIAG